MHEQTAKGNVLTSNLLAIGAHFANQNSRVPVEFRDQSEATNQETRQNGIGQCSGMLLAGRVVWRGEEVGTGRSDREQRVTTGRP